jgi:hypothetical protein
MRAGMNHHMGTNIDILANFHIFSDHRRCDQCLVRVGRVDKKCSVLGQIAILVVLLPQKEFAGTLSGRSPLDCLGSKLRPPGFGSVDQRNEYFQKKQAGLPGHLQASLTQRCFWITAQIDLSY